LQVNEIKSLLTTILKGKAKEMDPEDMILEPPKAGGSKVGFLIEAIIMIIDRVDQLIDHGIWTSTKTGN